MTVSSNTAVTAAFQRFVLALKNGSFEAYEALHSLARHKPVSRERFQANSTAARRLNLQYAIETLEIDEEAGTATLVFRVSAPGSPQKIERDQLELVLERGGWFVKHS